MVVERGLDPLLPVAALLRERLAQPDAGAQIERNGLLCRDIPRPRQDSNLRPSD